MPLTKTASCFFAGRIRIPSGDDGRTVEVPPQKIIYLKGFLIKYIPAILSQG